MEVVISHLEVIITGLILVYSRKNSGSFLPTFAGKYPRKTVSMQSICTTLFRVHNLFLFYFF